MPTGATQMKIIPGSSLLPTHARRISSAFKEVCQRATKEKEKYEWLTVRIICVYGFLVYIRNKTFFFYFVKLSMSILLFIPKSMLNQC